MNLLKAKDCSKCSKSIVYGSSDNMIVKCTATNSKIQDNFKENGKFCAAYCEGFVQSNKKRSGIIAQKDAIRFLLGGNSEFILHSTKNGEDYRFILKAEKANYDDRKIVYFVTLVKGYENIYCGILYIDDKTHEIKFSQGNKGKLSAESVYMRSLLFIVSNLVKNNDIQNLVLYSVGKCGCCGKELVEDEDISRGIHEKCIKQSMYDIKIKNVLENKENG